MGGGDILIGHGLLIGPALLLQKTRPLDEGRLLDFTSLINALVLHDRLLVLPAQLPSELTESDLYEYLVQRGILNELDFPFGDLPPEFKFEAADLYGEEVSITALDGVSGNSLMRLMYREYNPDLDDSLYSQHVEFERSRAVDQIIGYKGKDASHDDASSSGKGTLDDYRLRTIAYWVVSGYLGLAFLPDFARIPLITGYHARLRQSLRMFIDSQVDAMERRRQEPLLGDASYTLVPIPPSAMNFLERYESSTLAESLDGMRKDFADGRKAIVEWEEKMSNARKGSLDDVEKIWDQVRASLEALANDKSSSQAFLAAAPGSAQNLLPGGSVGAAVTGLAATAFEIVQRWHRSRRISFFQTGRREASALRGQDDLLKHAFRNSLTPRQSNRFSALTDSLEALAKPLSR